MSGGSRRAPGAAVIALALVLGACSGGSPDSASTPSSRPPSTSTPSPSPPSTAAPSGLEIPEIGLSVPLHPEGLRNGVVNPEAGTVMWVDGYDRVPPGELGTAVVAGHVVDGDTPDVFADLAEIDTGDTFTITDTDGAGTAWPTSWSWGRHAEAGNTSARRRVESGERKFGAPGSCIHDPVRLT